jgi:hypothetical protein
MRSRSVSQIFFKIEETKLDCRYCMIRNAFERTIFKVE